MFYAYKDGKNFAGSKSEEKLKSLCSKLNVTEYTISEEPPEPPKPPTLTQEQQLAKSVPELAVKIPTSKMLEEHLATIHFLKCWVTFLLVIISKKKSFLGLGILLPII